VADVIAGNVIRSPRAGYLNLIHVADAVRAVLASWQNPGQRLYVVADDHPVVRGDFYADIARRCQAPPPQFVDPPANAPVTIRSSSNKRIWNRRFKRDLIPKLNYPSYREGLADVLKRR
jgi:nucleoside-diphosphate-sugar epimerase